MARSAHLAGVAALTAVIGFPAASTHADNPRPDTHTSLVAVSKWPRIYDDLDWAGLAEGLERQLNARHTGDSVMLGEKRYTAEHVQRTARRLLELAREATACLNKRSPPAKCRQSFHNSLGAEFELYTTRETPLLTAYYTPTIQVSERRNGAYQFPIFGLPPDGLRRITRNDIDFKNALAGRGLELYYARDRFDAYLLHVEGGGRVLVQDSSGTKPGKSRYLSYAGNNGLSLRLLEEYMVRHGMLHATDVSRHAQRQYLNAHPQFAEQILSSSPGYVYFRQSQESPEGNAGVPLTPGRSLALDPVHYPATGLVAFVVAPQPIPPGHGVPPESNPRNLRFRTLSRFFVAQDEGPYIRGAARFDLYFGEDDNALFLANNFRTAGKVFFLMLR